MSQHKSIDPKKKDRWNRLSRWSLALAGALGVTTLVAATSAPDSNTMDAGTPESAEAKKPRRGPANGRDTIYYSRYNRDSPDEANIRSVSYSFDGTTLSFDTYRDIAVLEGADGLLFAADGDLLVGGQLDSVYKFDPKGTGPVERALCDGTGAYHLALDPSRKMLWVGGAQPGALVEIPLDPFRDGMQRPLAGDDRVITQVAFIPDGSAFYTSSSTNGIGHFGRIDLGTFVTTRHLADIPGAHSMVFDRHSETILLFGDKHILQVDPATSAIVSDLDLTAHPALNQPFKNTIDQGTTDGNGLVFAAVNNGWMILVDFTESGTLTDPSSVVAAALLDTFLDDIAPIDGLGARPAREPNGPKSPRSPAPPPPPKSP